MVICCLGDSLTEGDYGIKGMTGIANIHEKNYPYFLKELTGAEVRNFGKCGFTASLYLDFYKSGAIKVNDADVIIILLGTNGGHSSVVETACNKDYKELINLLKKDSHAQIYVCTPPNATTNPLYSNCGYAKRVKEATLFVRALAKKENIKLIDLAKSKVITAKNENVLQANDGLHFVEEGYRVLAKEIYQGIK